MLLTFLVILTLAGALLAYWSLWVEPRSVRVLRYNVELEGLTQPMRAVVLSDLQPNDFHWPPDRMRTLFSALGEENPDLVLWLGDYFNAHDKGLIGFMERHPRLRSWTAKHSPVMEEIAHEMGMLKGRLGSYAILGNHDYAWSGAQTRAELEDVGITVMVNDIATIVDPSSGQKVQLLGYDDVSSQPVPDFDMLHHALSPDIPAIGLTHSPDTFELTTDGPKLMLAGHTHGGQVRLPYFGALYVPVRYPKYDWGWYFNNARSLLVISGLGTSLPPLRFLCRPEVAVLDLIPKADF